ncbi:biotin/lipoyl-containing protein [Labrenzia sp. OB1]|uniref:biotin/lipoyl-containing protein n=1 Tax=Labrenzia sp. OB1 TaxID=1561204 RepID=UPI000837F270|nr:biotin/lipoyl-containing protein [Labrenzia sp. OB1]
MTHEVIMPALGMAQETGLLLAWHKQPGDAVKIGDVLMEVETDKAAMEVEAQADGFVTELRAKEGEDVPVGAVIAIISASMDKAAGAPTEDAPATPAATTDKVGDTPQATPAAAKPAPQIPEKPKDTASPPEGRVQASPKAKRLAAEQGLDLTRLAKAGHPQPYRTADLEHLKSLQASQVDGGQFSAASQRIFARATVPAAAFDEFCNWLAGQGAVTADLVLATFAAGSFRSATGLQSLAVSVSAPRKPSRIFQDPDRCGLLDLSEDEDGQQADLIVYDLTASRLTEAELAATHAPTVTIGRSQADLTVSLSATRDQLDDTALIAMLDAFAGRLEEPLRQLL